MIRNILRTKEIYIFLPLLAFSIFLMFGSFQVTPSGSLKLGAKLWSDFAATIPLIRSFSLGANFPPQYPIFAGPPIRYHFLFYLFVGLFEKIGVRLDWALNLPSAISFFLLTLVIYLLGSRVFKNKAVGTLSVILFLFNGSLSFIEFFKNHSLSTRIFQEIINLKDFVSFGPYDGKAISAFWSLNIFTNQRHLALAYFSFLLLILFLYNTSSSEKKFSVKSILAISFFIGLFPFIHLAVFGMMLVALGVFFLLYPIKRRELFIVGVLSLAFAIPQILFMGKAQVEFSYFNPGYLIENPNLLNIIKYWIMNLGLTVFLAPLGFLLSNKRQKSFFLPFLSLFVVGNILQFTPDIPTNHKFFNLFLVGCNFFTAYFLVWLWKKGLSRLIVPVLLFFLIISGIIDFFPILNDRYLEIDDIPINKAATFIAGNTPKDSVFLNASFLYDSASLAGRKIYLGWPYFSWGAGYDTTERFELMKRMLDARGGLNDTCPLLVESGIDYIELKKPTDLLATSIDYQFFEENFTRTFYDPVNNVYIYSVLPSCGM